VDKELIDKLCACDKDTGDKAKALGTIIAAEINKETEMAKIQSEEKKSKKERILGWVKAGLTFLGGVIAAAAAIFNCRSVMKFEETGTIRSKAWTGVKPEKSPEIR
jgi:hypothetical protein